MNIYKNALIAIAATAGVFVSCTRHVIVPAPEPPVSNVDVECKFDGIVDTLLYSLKDGTNSYGCHMLVTKNIQPSPFSSNAIYSDSLGSSSPAFKSGIRLDMGRFSWVDDGTNNPAISEFKTFFTGTNLMLQYGDSVQIPYSNGALNGVQITWYNSNGIAYYSSDTSTFNGRYFLFNNVNYEADNTNEYVKWSASFTCQLWNVAGDSVVINNGTFQGAFKRRTQ